MVDNNIFNTFFKIYEPASRRGREGAIGNGKVFSIEYHQLISQKE